MDRLKNLYITKKIRTIAIFIYLFGIWIMFMNGLLILGNILLLLKNKIYIIEIITSAYMIISTSLIYFLIYKIFFHRYVLYIEIKNDKLSFSTYKKTYELKKEKIKTKYIIFNLTIIQVDRKKFFINKKTQEYNKIKSYLI